MSEAKKLPAHEVVLKKLENLVTLLVTMRRDQHKSQSPANVDNMITITHINLLVAILDEMVIPEKHRKEVVGRVRKSAESLVGGFETFDYRTPYEEVVRLAESLASADAEASAVG